MSSVILYKEQRYWKCHTNEEEGYIEIEYGVKGTLNPVTRRRPVVPKASRSMREQCAQEMSQRANEKRHEGYTEDGGSVLEISTLSVALDVTEEIDDGIALSSATLPKTQTSGRELSRANLKLPMLAQKFLDRASKKNGVTYPLFVQPKANGVRGILILVDGRVHVYSRTLHTYFFMEKMRESALKLLSLRPDIVLDGELYVPGLPGQNITSIVSQKKTKHADDELVQLWLFDCYVPSQPGMLYSERKTLLEDLMEQTQDSGVVLMKSVVVNNKEELEAVHAKNQVDKWEGSMVRTDSPYEHKRSRYLMKYKYAEDMDTVISAITETEGGDVVLTLKMTNGKSFLHRPEGTVADKAKWLKDPSMIIDEIYSFSYTHLSEDGIPLAIHHGSIRCDL